MVELKWFVSGEKWTWKMKYCKTHSLPPAQSWAWERAEAAYARVSAKGKYGAGRSGSSLLLENEHCHCLYMAYCVVYHDFFVMNNGKNFLGEGWKAARMSEMKKTRAACVRAMLKSRED